MGSLDDQLRQAILAYDLDAADRLLRAGADPNVRVGEKRARSTYRSGGFAATHFTALHLAAYDDDVELAALLLNRGADPHRRLYAGVLPISIAAQRNHLATAELLLDEYERPRRPFAYCPLRLAASEGHLPMVELLLDRKPEAMDLGGALASAVTKKGNLAVIERLVRAGARADHVGPGQVENPVTIRMHALKNQPDALPLFVGHPHVRLIDAAIEGDLPAMERFLREGASPDDADSYGYQTALQGAARAGRLEAVRHLLLVGASLYGPRDKADPLFDSLRGGHLQVADLLWEAGCRTDDMVQRAVLLGAPREAVCWALDHAAGAQLDEALYAAARVKRVELAHELLERGADPNYRDRTRTPIMIACDRRDLPFVELLIAHGARVDAVDGSGRTPMHYALCTEDPDDPDMPFTYDDEALETPVVKLLASHGLAIPPREPDPR